MKHFLSILTMAAFVAVLTTSCKSDGDYPGRIFMPDMTYSNAYEAYASTNFQYQTDTDAISAMLPVHGTIPRGYLLEGETNRNKEAEMMALLFKNYFENPLVDRSLNDTEERARAAAMLSNPYERTEEVLAEGGKLYLTYCAICHGASGQGDGGIVILPDGSDGPYKAYPPTYESRLPGLSDGEMYYSISYGKNMMGGYASQVDAHDRWKLVHYIKEMAGIEENMVTTGGGAGEGSAPEFNLETIEVTAGAVFNVPDIYYETGSASVLASSHPTLDMVAQFFKSNPDVLVEIGSHADARGDAEKNMELSVERAKSVVDYLVAQGVKKKQLVPAGYGSNMPAVVCDPCTDEQHQMNRRTTFKILEVN